MDNKYSVRPPSRGPLTTDSQPQSGGDFFANAVGTLLVGECSDMLNLDEGTTSAGLLR